MALKYIVEQIGEIAFLAATMRPEHAAAMRQKTREKLTNETYPGLEAVWSEQLGEQIAESASAILTNRSAPEAELQESHLRGDGLRIRSPLGLLKGHASSTRREPLS
jgi:hypothetical protein